MDNKNFQSKLKNKGIASWKMLAVIFFAAGLIAALVWLYAINANKNPIPPQLVGGFPEFAVYPGAALKDSQATGEGDMAIYIGDWTTSASVPQVMLWYIDALEHSNWRIEIPSADTNAPTAQFITAKNVDSGLILDLSVFKKNDGSATNIEASFITEAQLEEEEEGDVTIP